MLIKRTERKRTDSHANDPNISNPDQSFAHLHLPSGGFRFRRLLLRSFRLRSCEIFRPEDADVWRAIGGYPDKDNQTENHLFFLGGGPPKKGTPRIKTALWICFSRGLILYHVVF